VTDDEQGAQSAAATSGLTANRRDILRGATGLAAVALVGTALADHNRVAVAAGPNTAITGVIGDLGPFTVLAFSWGLSNSGTVSHGGGEGAGKANIQDVSLTRPTDALTPGLFVATASGQHFPTASLTVSDNKGNPVLRLELEDVLVTSLSLGGSGGGGGGSALTENLSLNFGKVKLTVGSESGVWDVAGNAGV
jgi:type VI secretion system secreted protein Hcp